MKGIKIELLGITIIPLGIAVTTNNFWGYVLGVLGFGVAVVGCFLKDNHLSLIHISPVEIAKSNKQWVRTCCLFF